MVFCRALSWGKPISLLKVQVLAFHGFTSRQGNRAARKPATSRATFPHGTAVIHQISWKWAHRLSCSRSILEPHTINAHYIAAMLFFFVVFGDNMVRWIEGSETSHWFWLFSGKGEVPAVFGTLSVLALFAYWSRIGRVLKASDWPPERSRYVFWPYGVCYSGL